MKPWNWDYNLPDDWKPKTPETWGWYLVRKLNYEDLEGINRQILEKYFDKMDKELDPGKRILVTYYLTGKTP